MKNKYLLGGIGITAIILIIILFNFSGDDNKTSVSTKVKKGVFEVNVTTTGELIAKNSEDILGPPGMRAAGIWQVQISDLVPEGTIVAKGDYIATLDRTEATSKLKDIESELQKTESQYIQNKLDTTLNLRAARDELINLEYALEEKKIILDQSKFEPPAAIRQAEINLEKSIRALEQAIENYKIKQEQARAKMAEITATLGLQKSKHTQILDLLDRFVIKAPEPGMVIYVREWNGKKKKVGSNISPWNLAVATLPDLSEMTSKTFINEIDIGKIKKGQTVKIGVDALPDKFFTGEVISVANVGEEKPNSTAKVFEVEIVVNEADTILRPSMTTSNQILVSSTEDALFIPLECLHGDDSSTYVYKQLGFRTIKQEVEVGITNDNQAIILNGLIEKDKVLISTPKEASDMKLVPIKTAKL
ncbi:MAG: HlyD family efflux transporter periplasmic adaptor subunit [Bacteroidetes bacterium]|nr:HlyD family efflux transporter periplasmic adaptor subunit [Bacteroidota bacterium]